MYTVLNQNVSWFYKKIKLGVRKPKIPQAQTCSLLLSTRHTLQSHSCQAEQLSPVVMDGMFTGIYLQHFPKVTGRHSSLPFLVNLSLVSSMKRDKSENGCSAASPLVLHSGCEPEWRLPWAHRGEDSRGGRPLHLRSLLPQPRREEAAASSKSGTGCCSFGKQLADMWYWQKMFQPWSRIF